MESGTDTLTYLNYNMAINCCPQKEFAFATSLLANPFDNSDKSWPASRGKGV